MDGGHSLTSLLSVWLQNPHLITFHSECSQGRWPLSLLQRLTEMDSAAPCIGGLFRWLNCQVWEPGNLGTWEPMIFSTDSFLQTETVQGKHQLQEVLVRVGESWVCDISHETTLGPFKNLGFQKTTQFSRYPMFSIVFPPILSSLTTMTTCFLSDWWTTPPRLPARAPCLPRATSHLSRARWR